MTTLGPRTVTVHFLGGPADGNTCPYLRDDLPMPDQHAGYRLIGPAAEDTSVWLYRWVPLRTGRREPCTAGCERYPGSRCPSAGRRQTA